MDESADSTNYVQVATATPDRETALGLARSAVTNQLAAGAQVFGPVASVVWHLGELTEGEEWVLTLITRADRQEELTALLREAHPWTNPQLTASAMTALTSEYAEWLDRLPPPRVSNQPDPTAGYWTMTAVAAYLGVQIGTVSSYHGRGQMPPGCRMGRTWVWRPQTIIRWRSPAAARRAAPKGRPSRRPKMRADAPPPGAG